MAECDVCGAEMKSLIVTRPAQPFPRGSAKRPYGTTRRAGTMQLRMSDGVS